MIIVQTIRFDSTKFLGNRHECQISITSLLPVLFGASNWNETRHILMDVKFESNGMSYINVCKIEGSKPLSQ